MFNPNKIDRQKNHFWIKEILKHYKRLNAAVRKKKNYSVIKESNKFAKKKARLHIEKNMHKT